MAPAKPKAAKASLHSFFQPRQSNKKTEQDEETTVTKKIGDSSSPAVNKRPPQPDESKALDVAQRITKKVPTKKRRVIEDSSDEEDKVTTSATTPDTTTPSSLASDDPALKQDALSLTAAAACDPAPPNDNDGAAAAVKSAPLSSSVNEIRVSDTNRSTKNNKKAPETKSAALADADKNEAQTTTSAEASCDPNAKTRKKSPILQALKKGSVKTDEKLLQEIDATWQSDMPYSVLCLAFSQIEEITGRLLIQEILTNLFRSILLKSPHDFYPILYLASNSVAPAYECVELGIGDSLLIKAIAEATGSTVATIKTRYEAEGDLGSVAQHCKSKQKTLGSFFTSTKPATASADSKLLKAKDVLAVFRTIAQTKGNQSQKWKVDQIKKILVKASSGLEIKYIIRGLQGKLRIGLAQSTVLISMAHALALTIPLTVADGGDTSSNDKDCPEEALLYKDKSATPEKRLEAAVAIIKKAYSEVPSYDAILDAAMKVPLQEMHKACTLTPGIPVAPMLAKPTKSVQEVLKRLTTLKFTCEYKYDGERAQIHLLPDGTTKVFSRNLLDTSEKYPEVPLFVKEACKENVQSYVLDAEVVAYNNKTGQLVPFQILSTRKKTEESAETAKVQVIVQAFDIMFLNGQSLLNRSLADRRELLHEHFVPVEGKFKFAEAIDHEENGDTAILEEFLEAAVKGQCEGLMIKTLEVNAIYEPSRRSLNWLKLKKDYLQGLGDSVDLVPLGAYHGRGKRTGVYGAYLLACFDPDTEEFQSVCKIGTGFSDEDLRTLSDKLNQHIIPTKSSQYQVSDALECDVWFDAQQVWEIKAADLSKSSAHRGAEGKTGEAGRGIGLRFPRFERVRDDKRPEEATTSDQILEMYYAQDTIVGGEDEGLDDDGI